MSCLSVCMNFYCGLHVKSNNWYEKVNCCFFLYLQSRSETFNVDVSR